MEMGLLEALLEYGSLGLFAAFLVWQHLSMQKRFDTLIERFQKQLDAFQNKSDANEEKLRDRYDAVINQYQNEKANFNQIYLRKITAFEKSLKILPFETILIQIEALSATQRAIEVTIDKGMEILKSMQDEAKLRDIARQIKDER